MKYLFCICSLLIGQIALSQKLPADGTSKVRIAMPDKLVVAEVIPVSQTPKLINGVWYWWYGGGTIHATQDGFAGKLLNGKYQEFYPNKNLREEGDFKKGLKDGRWKAWDDNGSLTETTFWKKGVQVSGEKTPILERFNIFKKRARKDLGDTSKKQ